MNRRSFLRTTGLAAGAVAGAVAVVVAAVAEPDPMTDFIVTAKLPGLQPMADKIAARLNAQKHELYLELVKARVGETFGGPKLGYYLPGGKP